MITVSLGVAIGSGDSSTVLVIVNESTLCTF